MDLSEEPLFPAVTTSSDFSLGAFEPLGSSSAMGEFGSMDLLPSETQSSIARDHTDEGLSSSYTSAQPQLDIEAVIRNLSVVATNSSTRHSSQSSLNASRSTSQHASAFGTPKAYSTASSGASSPTFAAPHRSGSRSSGRGSRRNSAESRRKRKEPKREEYPTDEEYNDAYRKWRAQRDSNNRSVKRSREKAKERLSEMETQNRVLMNQIETLQQQVEEAKSLAFRARHQPDALSPEDDVLIQSWAA
eukprot:TRINITY_DN12321_c1_g6_i1.p1 TRINITY_DN12321_c1_g6~~TRINITY_DN12321_c1_g6_i1.p1  ORF type:complete len:247 (+),score=57.87 TRINITY_DN12321_c1_g6_i1:1015-1755(+)